MGPCSGDSGEDSSLRLCSEQAGGTDRLQEGEGRVETQGPQGTECMVVIQFSNSKESPGVRRWAAATAQRQSTSLTQSTLRGKSESLSLGVSAEALGPAVPTGL